MDCGIIPEVFAHDSTEEKLWAKYCDILLSLTFNQLGIASRVLRTRGDSADVFGETREYTLVADAKAFRLSRTAKNQKDFKVNALNDWRRENTFACLVAPLYQYPQKSSQIYKQAIDQKVLLISFVHLRFLLDHVPSTALNNLWQIPQQLTPSKEAQPYWLAIDAIVLQLTQQSIGTLHSYKQQDALRALALADEGTTYWQNRIAEYQQLSREVAIQRLIQAEKLDQKIDSIQQTVEIIRGLYGLY
jgi:type II restriction enzyme